MELKLSRWTRDDLAGFQAPRPSVVGVAMTLPLQPWVSKAPGFRTTGFFANATKESRINEVVW